MDDTRTRRLNDLRNANTIGQQYLPPLQTNPEVSERDLKNRDFWFLIDRSGSMYSNRDCPGGSPGNKVSRWLYVKESIASLASELDELDSDGISLVLFNHTVEAAEDKKYEAILEILENTRPIGGTNLTLALRHAFEQYLRKRATGKAKPNGGMIVVLTDGEPSEPDTEDAVAQEIINFTQKFPEGRLEFGISFIQVGFDPKASAFLDRLNNHLRAEGARLDMVNHIKFDDVAKLGLKVALIRALTE